MKGHFIAYSLFNITIALNLTTNLRSFRLVAEIRLCSLPLLPSYDAPPNVLIKYKIQMFLFNPVQGVNKSISKN